MVSRIRAVPPASALPVTEDEVVAATTFVSTSIPAMERIWWLFQVERVVRVPSRSFTSSFSWACAAEARPIRSASDATNASLMLFLSFERSGPIAMTINAPPVALDTLPSRPLPYFRRVCVIETVFSSLLSSPIVYHSSV